jgi:hypothetical protein
MTIPYYMDAVLQHSLQTHGEGWVSANLEAILNKYNRSLAE